MMVVSKEPRKDAETLLREFYDSAPIDAFLKNPKFSVALPSRFERSTTRPVFRTRCDWLTKPCFARQTFSISKKLRVNLTAMLWQLACHYTLWRSIPDSELIEAAESGELLTDAGLQKQFDRMLARSQVKAIHQRLHGPVARPSQDSRHVTGS